MTESDQPDNHYFDNYYHDRRVQRWLATGIILEAFLASGVTLAEIIKYDLPALLPVIGIICIASIVALKANDQIAKNKNPFIKAEDDLNKLLEKTVLSAHKGANKKIELIKRGLNSSDDEVGGLSTRVTFPNQAENHDYYAVTLNGDLREIGYRNSGVKNPREGDRRSRRYLPGND